MSRHAEKTQLGLMDLFGVMFIALKITGDISWSWWVVTAPLWAPYVVATLVLLVRAYEDA